MEVKPGNNTLMKNEVYLICNVHRSGSSMMMRCLEAGGMPVVYSGDHESLNYDYNTPDYVPNPNGFYAPPSDFENVTKYVGSALKFDFHLLLTLPVGIKYNILFMKRNPDEIRASMEAFMPNQSWSGNATILEFYDFIIDTILDEVRKRNDTIVTVLNYADVVKNPQQEFQKLVDAGWSFDIEKASEKVDESLHRFKLEQK